MLFFQVLFDHRLAVHYFQSPILKAKFKLHQVPEELVDLVNFQVFKHYNKNILLSAIS